MSKEYAKSIDKEASKAFKKVKYDIEELKRLVNTKQDKQDNILLELNKTKSELRIEFKEDMLEIQRTMDKEVNTLRKEILYYRELCENYRKEVVSRDNNIKEYVNKVINNNSIISHSHIQENSRTEYSSNLENQKNSKIDENNSTSNEREFHYKRIVTENPEFKPTPQPQEFESSHINNSTTQDNSNKKTYLKWITVGDSDLDSIDEVYIR